MKKVIIVLLSLSLACSCLFAQNTGYMGRHVLVNGEISLSPAYLKPNPLGEALSGKVKSQSALNYLGMNYIVSPNVEVIVWRKGSVGAGYNFYKSPFDGKEYIPDHYGYSYDFVDYQGLVIIFMERLILEICICIKIYGINWESNL